MRLNLERKEEKIGREEKKEEKKIRATILTGNPFLGNFASLSAQQQVFGIYHLLSHEKRILLSILAI